MSVAYYIKVKHSNRHNMLLEKYFNEIIELKTKNDHLEHSTGLLEKKNKDLIADIKKQLDE